MVLHIDFHFEVGKHEKHLVAFHWGQLWGKVLITVDGQEVVQRNKAVSFHSPRTRTFELSVGENEVHPVVIEKTQKSFLGGARKQTCRAFVDGELIGEY
ncbi:MAG: hypothetical protein ACLQRH_11200 [Acidimicrobiales bacterium]|jgi:hypothetical protein